MTLRDLLNSGAAKLISVVRIPRRPPDRQNEHPTQNQNETPAQNQNENPTENQNLSIPTNPYPEFEQLTKKGLSGYL